jgi:ABC-2 family transporter protein
LELLDSPESVLSLCLLARPGRRPGRLPYPVAVVAHHTSWRAPVQYPPASRRGSLGLLLPEHAASSLAQVWATFPLQRRRLLAARLALRRCTGLSHRYFPVRLSGTPELLSRLGAKHHHLTALRWHATNPIEVLLGKITGAALVSALVFQAAWGFLLLAANRLLLALAVRRVTIQGGRFSPVHSAGRVRPCASPPGRDLRQSAGGRFPTASVGPRRSGWIGSGASCCVDRNRLDAAQGILPTDGARQWCGNVQYPLGAGLRALLLDRPEHRDRQYRHLRGTEMASYPLPLYHEILQRFFTFVVPLAFVSYFPALNLLD